MKHFRFTAIPTGYNKKRMSDVAAWIIDTDVLYLSIIQGCQPYLFACHRRHAQHRLGIPPTPPSSVTKLVISSPVPTSWLMDEGKLHVHQSIE